MMCRCVAAEQTYVCVCVFDYVVSVALLIAVCSEDLSSRVGHRLAVVLYELELGVGPAVDADLVILYDHMKYVVL